MTYAFADSWQNDPRGVRTHVAIPGVTIAPSGGLWEIRSEHMPGVTIYADRLNDAKRVVEWIALAGIEGSGAAA